MTTEREKTEENHCAANKMVWTIIPQKENEYERCFGGILDEDRKDKGCKLLMN